MKAKRGSLVIKSQATGVAPGRGGKVETGLEIYAWASSPVPRSIAPRSCGGQDKGLLGGGCAVWGDAALQAGGLLCLAASCMWCACILLSMHASGVTHGDAYHRCTSEVTWLLAG
jgi:hypothetical protein